MAPEPEIRNRSERQNEEEDTTYATMDDLWNEAVERLKNKPGFESIPAVIEEELAEIFRSNPIDVDGRLAANDFYQELVETMGVRQHNNNARRIASRSVKLLDTFLLNVKGPRGLDPAHITSAPWALSRYALNCFQAKKELSGQYLTGISIVTSIIVQAHIYHQLYMAVDKSLRPSPSIVEQLKISIVEALSESQLLLGLIIQQRKTKTEAFWKSPVLVTDIRKHIDNLLENERLLGQARDVCESSCNLLNRTKVTHLIELSNTFSSITDGILTIKSVLRRLDENALFETLQWISPIRYGDHHIEVSESRTEGTCEWILQTSEFREWENSDSSSVLWLSGSAGAGKTFLISKVVDFLKESFENLQHQNEGLAFFYCNRIDETRRDVGFILRSYVRQLSRPAGVDKEMREDLWHICQKAKINGSTLSKETCQNQLLESFALYDKTTLIIDALDECDDSTRRELLTHIRLWLQKSENPIKILISSRPDPETRDRIKSWPSLEIQATDNQVDIEKFLYKEITKHRKWKKMPQSLRLLIIQRLRDGSQGMFQWANLQIQQLFQIQTEKEIRQRLGRLPSTLEKAYEEIYHNCTKEEDAKFIVDSACMWVMCTSVPLGSLGLMQAIYWTKGIGEDKPELNEDLLRDLCNNLLTLDTTSRLWRFTHLSVAEYFEKSHANLSDSHCQASKACLRFLINPQAHDGHDRDGSGSSPSKNTAFDFASPRRFPFVGDSAPHLPHLSNAGSLLYQTGSSDIESDSQGIDTDDHSVGTRSHYGNAFPGLSMVQWATNDKFGHFRSYSNHSWYFHVTKYETALSASGDKVDAVLTELLKGFLGLPMESSAYYRKWLEYYSLSDFSSAIFTYETRAPDELHLRDVALAIMCRLGLWNLLQDWWDNVVISSAYRGFNMNDLLIFAAQGGCLQICELLLKRGIPVDHVASRGEPVTALATAAERGETHLAIVKYLIAEGARVNLPLRSSKYCNALAAAVESPNNLDTIKYLIGKGAEMNWTSGRYGSALAAAVTTATIFNEDLRTVEYLVQQGAEINLALTVGSYGSALVAAAAAAAEWGTLNAVQYLIQHGAEINLAVTVGDYGSALAAAAADYRGFKTVDYLVQQGAEINLALTAGKYGSALAAAAAAAAQWGDLDTVDYLVQQGAEINLALTAGKHGSALVAAAAAAWGSLTAVKYLVQRGARVDMALTVGEHGSALAAATAATVSAGYGDLETIEYLISQGAQVNAELSSSRFGSVLAIAAYSGDLSVVEFLIKQKADVNLNLSAGRYGSALVAAAAQGLSEMVKFLVENGAQINPNRSLGEYGSPLAAAARAKAKAEAEDDSYTAIICSDTMHFLVARGAHVEILSFLDQFDGPVLEKPIEL